MQNKKVKTSKMGQAKRKQTPFSVFKISVNFILLDNNLLSKKKIIIINNSKV